MSEESGLIQQQNKPLLSKLKLRQRKATIIGAVVGVVVLLLAVIGTVVAILVLHHSSYEILDYGVMLDAGSSGTRAYVYSWPHRKTDTVPVVSSVEKLVQLAQPQEVKPGIANINVSDIKTYLQPLLDYASGLIPSSKLSETPIYLKATAGMRLLPQPKRDLIIAETRSVLNSSSFLFAKDEWAQVISGEDEGVFGWVTTSFLTGALFGATGGEVGALDMGGASLQISFVPDTIPLTDLRYLTIAETKHSLFTHSFLARGQDTTLTKLLEFIITESAINNTTPEVIANPCYLQGYNEIYYSKHSQKNYSFSGSGETDACAQLLVKILNISAYCPIQPCSFDGAYQPLLRGKFYAMSGFYYTASFLGISNNENSTSPETLWSLTNKYCSKTWKQVIDEYPNVNENYLKGYCFSGSYIYTLLVKGFGFKENDSNSIIFTGDIQGTTLNWALGAMIYEASLMPWG